MKILFTSNGTETCFLAWVFSCDKNDCSDSIETKLCHSSHHEPPSRRQGTAKTEKRSRPTLSIILTHGVTNRKALKFLSITMRVFLAEAAHRDTAKQFRWHVWTSRVTPASWASALRLVTVNILVFLRGSADGKVGCSSKSGRESQANRTSSTSSIADAKARSERCHGGCQGDVSSISCRHNASSDGLGYIPNLSAHKLDGSNQMFSVDVHMMRDQS